MHVDAKSFDSLKNMTGNRTRVHFDKQAMDEAANRREKQPTVARRCPKDVRKIHKQSRVGHVDLWTHTKPDPYRTRWASDNRLP